MGKEGMFGGMNSYTYIFWAVEIVGGVNSKIYMNSPAHFRYWYLQCNLKLLIILILDLPCTLPSTHRDHCSVGDAASGQSLTKPVAVQLRRRDFHLSL